MVCTDCNLNYIYICFFFSSDPETFEMCTASTFSGWESRTCCRMKVKYAFVWQWLSASPLVRDHFLMPLSSVSISQALDGPPRIQAKKKRLAEAIRNLKATPMDSVVTHAPPPGEQSGWHVQDVFSLILRIGKHCMYIPYQASI